MNRVGLVRLANFKAKQGGDGFNHFVDGVLVGEAHSNLLGRVGFRQFHVNSVDVFHRFNDGAEAHIVEVKHVVGLQFFFFHFGIRHRLQLADFSVPHAAFTWLNVELRHLVAEFVESRHANRS